ncbi:hypothetical protein AMTRI_Chr08g166450 [Amborella trichopoda]
MIPLYPPPYPSSHLDTWQPSLSPTSGSSGDSSTFSSPAFSLLQPPVSLNSASKPPPRRLDMSTLYTLTPISLFSPLRFLHKLALFHSSSSPFPSIPSIPLSSTFSSTPLSSSRPPPILPLPAPLPSSSSSPIMLCQQKQHPMLRNRRWKPQGHSAPLHPLPNTPLVQLVPSLSYLHFIGFPFPSSASDSSPFPLFVFS